MSEIVVRRILYSFGRKLAQVQGTKNFETAVYTKHMRISKFCRDEGDG